jgi:hypothetical protein
MPIFLVRQSAASKFMCIEDKLIIGFVIAFAIWVFCALPFLYQRPITQDYYKERSQAANIQANTPGNRAGISTTSPEQIVAKATSENHQTAEGNKDNDEFLSAKLTDWLLALFTLALVIFTRELVRSTNRLWEAGERQLQFTNAALSLSRDEFLSSHRPRMRLKHAWFTDQTSWRLGGPLEINLDFVNVGNTDAYVQMVNYQSLLIPLGEKLPQRPPYDEVPSSGIRITRFPTFVNPPSGALPSGTTFARQVCDGILSEQHVKDIIWGTQGLYLIGTVEYVDALRRIRQTAFCRRLTYQTYPPTIGDMGRFEVENDPDYEYED